MSRCHSLAFFLYLHAMPLTLKTVILLVFASGISAASYSFGQDFVNDTVVRNDFQMRLKEMVEDLEMTDSVETAFYEIYTEYGLFMKQAYENRVGWLRLYQEYEWASRDRDSKMKMILDESQFDCFKRHQYEIEQEARKNR